MFKQNIEYVDFNGETRKEDFYFHLSLPEVARLEAKYGRKLGEQAKYVVDRLNLNEILEFLETLILTSYGEKSADGRSFRKSEEIRSNFENSQAYAELFEMLLTDPELASKFGAGVADNSKKKNVVNPSVVSE